MRPDYDYNRVLDHMRDHGIRSARGWTNRLVVGEAMYRGLQVTGTRTGLASIRSKKTKHWFLNGASSLNRPLARRCANLKEVSSRLLRSRGVSAPESVVFQPGDAKRAYSWAETMLPVVVKPSSANRGRGVHVGVSTWEEFENAFDAVSREFGEVLVEEQLVGVMHRITVVDGVVVAALLQYPANVVGDGTLNVRELIGVKNSNLGVIHKRIKEDELAIQQLEKQGRDFFSVPEKGERLYLQRTSNIASGGDAVDVTNSIQPEVKTLLAEAARAIPGLRFAGYDVMLPEAARDPAPSILEVNPQPGIHAHHFPRYGEPQNVANALIDAMFPETRSG